MSTPDQSGPASTESPQAPSAPETKLPNLPMRMLDLFFSPGKLTRALAEHPAWVAALLVGVVLLVGQTLLIPTEVWQSMMRETMLRRGQEMPQNLAVGGSFFRIASVVGGTLGYLIMTAVFSGLVTLVFAFILGDEGRYKQYLSMTAHAWLIPLLVGFALVPLKIAQADPRLTLNVGTFLFFLPSGYLLKWATAMDLAQGWGWVIIAAGAHAIDPRRSFKSALIACMLLFVGLAAIFAIWIPLPE